MQAQMGYGLGRGEFRPDIGRDWNDNHTIRINGSPEQRDHQTTLNS
jgi:hypothetical protein